MSIFCGFFVLYSPIRLFPGSSKWISHRDNFFFVMRQEFLGKAKQKSDIAEKMKDSLKSSPRNGVNRG